MIDFVLGSASPRRTELLSSLGIAHRVVPADIDETPAGFELALPYVRRMAAAKADAVLARLAHLMQEQKVAERGSPLRDTLVLTADTVVIADGMILGKPRDEADGCAMLARLSGRKHEVATAVSVRLVGGTHGEGTGTGTGAVAGAPRRGDVCVQTTVQFRSVTVQEARRYWASGEPIDKAGGYGIQGAAREFVSNIDGSYTNVIGLPLVETRLLLRAFGV